MEYYETKYGKKMSQNQPLLKVTRRGKTIYLIPELCFSTSLDESERQNENLKRELTQISKKTPYERVIKTKEFLSMFNENPTKGLLDQWDIQVDTQPRTVEGKILAPGKLVMNQGKEYVEIDRNLNNNTVRGLFDSGRSLDKVYVFCVSKDKSLVQNFIDKLGDARQKIKNLINQPELFTIAHSDWESWRTILSQKITSDVRLAIIVLPGKGKSSSYYNDIKRYLLTPKPVLSQVVMSATLQSNKINSLSTK
jgi:PAZ domain.